jgi:hypothetical protein
MIRSLIRAITNAAEEEELRQTLNRLGRINFVFRTLTITGLAFAFEFLGEALLHLTQLPHVLYVVQRIILFGAFGTILLRGIDRRLMDAGLARWFRYPIIAAWLLAVSLPAAWPSGWQIGLCLFLLLLILGCSARGTPLPTEFDSASVPTAPKWNAYAPRIRYQPKWFISPVSFLRSLLTLACLWLPLICLENASGGGTGIWFARFGYCILSLIWFYVLVGRLDDAGRLPRKRYGFILIGLVLLAGLLFPAHGEGWSAHLHSSLLSRAASFLYLLRVLLRCLNGYEILALFLVIQVPLALLPSKPMPPELLAEINRRKDDLNKKMPVVKISKSSLCGPFEYLRILMVITCFWIPLIYLDNVSSGSVGSWIARIGYLILGCFWLIFANGRIEDAGWSHSQYPAQFALVVSVVSLMPLAFHWVNGYGALAIFVLIQTPTALLRSKRKMGGWGGWRRSRG